MEPVRSYCNHLAVAGEYSQHLSGQKLKTQGTKKHQTFSHDQRIFQYKPAPFYILRCIIITDYRNNAGL